MMKFNSNKSSERIDFSCEDVSERSERKSDETEDENIIPCFACIEESKESDTQTNLNTGSKFIKTMMIKILGDYKTLNK